MFGLNKPIITSGGYALDYLFVAETYNHNIIKQTPDDKPKFSKWGTMMTDLRNEKVKKFSLVGKGHIFTVDLTDGHVEVDGQKLYPPTPVFPGAKLQPIYYRQITRDLVTKENLKEQAPKVKYFLGWQYNMNGKNYKWEMGVGD